MGNLIYHLSAAELLLRLSEFPLHPAEREDWLWGTAELPAPLQAYYNYLSAEEDGPADGELRESAWRFCLDGLLDAEECYSDHELLEGERETAAEYAKSLEGHNRNAEEEAWLAAYPAHMAELDCALAAEDFLVIGVPGYWHAGIRQADWGMPDPPVWLRRQDCPGRWLPLTETTGEFVDLLLMTELSSGRRCTKQGLCRSPLPEAELPADAPEPPENGYLTAWSEDGQYALFLTRAGGRLSGMRVQRAAGYRSEDTWMSRYLYDNLKSWASEGFLEPFCLAAYCERRGLGEQAAILRRTVEPDGVFALPELVPAATMREYRHMDSACADLSALAACTGLKELRVPRNRISDLSPLRGLTNLRDLALSDNRIHSLEPLAGLTALGYLNLSGNPITSEELQHLRKLKRLKMLLLNNTLVDDLTPLAGYRGRTLDLAGCPLRTGFEVLKTRTRLTCLTLDLATERAYHIGELVPWLNIRVERSGLVQLACKAYMEG